MAPGRKLGAGCWTCRLRRKRCDTVRPVCGGCQDLEITCHSGETRPLWMDGGDRQKHMMETVKGEIKQAAFARRERRLVICEDQDVIVQTRTTHALPTNSAPSTLSTGSVESPYSLTSIPSTPGPAVPIQVQLGSVMVYLDYVFPFLFPFYQPSLIETGRQWLLGLLCQNNVAFHTAANLSAYFFTLVPQSEGQDMHDECKALVRDKLLEHMHMAIQSIQSTVLAISLRSAPSPLLDQVRVMEEVTQLLMVEVTVQRNIEWGVHLTPALVIFDEIFKSYGIDRSEPSLTVLLSALPSSLPITMPHHKPLPNTADQSALVFFVSLLLFIDVIASASLCRSPALQIYHRNLLSSDTSGTCPVRLETVVGCQNWALVAIGNISALCAWKYDARRSGSFSVVKMVDLAKPISQALEEGLTGLEIHSSHFHSHKMNIHRLEAYYSRHDRAVDHTTIANITRIWAYAAKIYLSVSLSGWQVMSREIQVNVTKVLSLLRTIESPGQLRSLSWPFCVAGCLSLPDQRNDFRCVVETLGQLGEFGTILNALRIMEAVWSLGDSIYRDVWDIASCLRIHGSSALLL